MFSIVRFAFTGALIVAGTVVAAERASAGIGYYYAAPSYYYAPPVYTPSYGFGDYGGPAYYGGYSPYGSAYLGTSTYYASPNYGSRYESYGYPGYGYYSPYRYYGYRPYRFGIGRSVFDIDD